MGLPFDCFVEAIYEEYLFYTGQGVDLIELALIDAKKEVEENKDSDEFWDKVYCEVNRLLIIHFTGELGRLKGD